MGLTRPGTRLLWAGLTLSSLVLGGCGFQLRGATAVPDALDPIFVDCAGNSPAALCDEVRELLELNQVTVNKRATPDSYILRITDLERTQRATAITGSAAAAEYDLRLRSTLSLLAPNAIPLIADAQISTNEFFRYDEANVLAKRREQQDLMEQLYRRLAQQIVFRLAPFTSERIQKLRLEHQSQQRPGASPEVPEN